MRLYPYYFVCVSACIGAFLIGGALTSSMKFIAQENYNRGHMDALVQYTTIGELMEMEVRI
jgi:hypothetical protein